MITNDQISAAWEERVLGKCVHEWWNTNRKNSLQNYLRPTLYVYRCSKCKHELPATAKESPSPRGSIPDHLNDPAVVLGEIIKGDLHVEPPHGAGLWRVQYNIESDRGGPHFHSEPSIDESLERAVLLAGLKRRGVKI